MAASKWFDYNVYMTNKLAQLQKDEPTANWDITKLVKAFTNAGFEGVEGAEKHFTQFGQAEDVAPNAFFNATEYYRAKAAQVLGKDPKAVTDVEAASMQVAIENAGMNAWDHYTKYGTAENVNPSNNFNSKAYMEAKLAVLQVAEPDAKWTMETLQKALQDAGLSALEHFMLYGGEGKGEVAQKYDPAKPTMPNEFAVPESEKVNPGGGSGKTFTLTTAVDTFTGTLVEDTFIASAAGSLNAGDTLDGGAGRDTLKIFGKAGTTFTGVSIKNIETFEFNNADLSGTDSYLGVGATPLDASQFAGLDTVKLANSKIGDGVVFTVNKMVDGGTVGLGGKITGDNNATANVAVSYVDAATTANLLVDNVSVLDADAVAAGNTNAVFATFTGKGLKTVNVNGTLAADTQGVALKQGAGTVIENLHITTTSKMTVVASDGSNANLKGLKVIDGSASTGDLKIVAEGLGQAATITGGKGNDIIEVGAEAVSRKHTINGGEGTDTLGLMFAKGDYTQNVNEYAVKQDTYDYLKSDKISNVEKLYFFTNVGNGGDYVSIDMAKVDFSYVATGMKAKITNLLSTDTIGLDTGYSSSAPGETYILTADTTNNKDKIVNVEGLKVDAVNYSWVAAIGGAGSDFKTLNISGKGNVGFDNHLSTTSNALTIDASKMEAGGKFYFAGSSSAKETVTLGAGADTIAFSASTAGYSFDKIDDIIGFAKNDTIAANVGVTTLTADKSITGTGSIDAATLQAKINTLVTTSGGANTAIQFGDDTYLVMAGASTGLTDDMVIRLAGVSVDHLVIDGTTGVISFA